MIPSWVASAITDPETLWIGTGRRGRLYVSGSQVRVEHPDGTDEPVGATDSSAGFGNGGYGE